MESKRWAEIKNEIIKRRVMDNDPNAQSWQLFNIDKAMDEWADIRSREVAIGFFKWNAMKVGEYVNYIKASVDAKDHEARQQAVSEFEGAPIEGRFDLYLQSLNQ